LFSEQSVCFIVELTTVVLLLDESRDDAAVW